MANPVQVFVSTYNGVGQQGQSGTVNFTFNNTAGFDAWIPIVIQYPATVAFSAMPEVSVKRSTDGGNTYETTGTLMAVFPRPVTAGELARQDINVGTGQFLITVVTGGGVATSYSVNMQTAYVITAYV